MFKLPKEIIDGIKDYRASLEDLTSGRTKASRFVGVRVPWGIYSHRGGRVFMNRIRIPGGAVTGPQLEAIAEMSRCHGQGMVHLTTRQDIQIHGVKIEDTVKVMEYLKDYDLSPRGGGGNTVRNVTACALAGVCPYETFDVRGSAVALTEYLLRQENSYNLPRKFKVSFSGCARDCAGGLMNDVGLFAASKDDRRGFRVFAGGGMGRDSHVGYLLEEFIVEEDVAYCVEAVKRVFFKYGDRKNKHHNRLRFFIADKGMAAFRELYERELKELKEREYLVLRRVVFPTRVDPSQEEGESAGGGDGDFQAFMRYSVRPERVAGFASVELRISRGDLTADEVTRLARLTEDFPGIEFRTSPEQNLYLCGVRRGDLRRLWEKTREIVRGILYPSTIIDVVCCKGALTCNLGLCNSPGLAQALEEMLRENFIGTNILEKLDIRLNGCPNACGQHPLGKIAFYGMARKVDNRPAPFYKLLLGGRKCAEKTELAQEVGVVAAKHIPDFLKEFLRSVESALGKDEDVHEFLKTRGRKIALDILQRYSYVPSYAENRDFYVDWGKTEEFSLEGMGPGECGAGVMDMIDSDLTESRVALDEAKSRGYLSLTLFRSLLLAARALLVVRGQEPKTEAEVFRAFRQKFVDEGIASEEYADIAAVAGRLTQSGRAASEAEIAYVGNFLEHIQGLYKAMDPSFNFPKIEKASEPAAELLARKESFILDLKGTPCPINYVKTKLFLENLNVGDIVCVLLDEGEPIQNVPESLKNDGQEILGIAQEGAHYRVTVKKIV